MFVAAGVLLLFFTAYLLWGTGVYTKNQQNHFKKELLSKQQSGPATVQANGRPATQPHLGDPLFSVKIPKIGLDTVVVYGVGLDQLKKGPGLFPDCKAAATSECVGDAKYPGEKGNVAISGHRTTYGAPFFRTNELAKGDTIDLIEGRTRYRYVVRNQEIVDPVAGFKVVEQHGKTELTLTSCHPRFSAAQRLIIHADYQGASLVAARPAGEGPEGEAAPPVIPTDVLLLASISAACALGSLALSRRYQKTAGVIAVSLAGAAALWILAFPQVVSRLPSNF